jgi:hypothetical protein
MLVENPLVIFRMPNQAGDGALASDIFGIGLFELDVPMPLQSESACCMHIVTDPCFD